MKYLTAKIKTWWASLIEKRWRKRKALYCVRLVLQHFPTFFSHSNRARERVAGPNVRIWKKCAKFVPRMKAPTVCSGHSGPPNTDC